MIKVEAIKFGSAVNAGSIENTFIKNDPIAKVEVYFDSEREVFVLVDKGSKVETIVFPTNVQWARLQKDSDESNKGAGAKRTHGASKAP